MPHACTLQVATLASNALGGNLSELSAPGATWVTPTGQLVAVEETSEPPAGTVAPGPTWVDSLGVRVLPGGGALLGTFCIWSMRGAARTSDGCRAVSALLVPGSGDGGGWRLAHLHESAVQAAATATAALQALAAGETALAAKHAGAVAPLGALV